MDKSQEYIDMCQKAKENHILGLIPMIKSEATRLSLTMPRFEKDNTLNNALIDLFELLENCINETDCWDG